MLFALSITVLFSVVQPATARPPGGKEDLKLRADLDKLRADVQDLEARLKKLGRVNVGRTVVASLSAPSLFHCQGLDEDGGLGRGR